MYVCVCVLVYVCVMLASHCKQKEPVVLPSGSMVTSRTAPMIDVVSGSGSAGVLVDPEVNNAAANGDC